jgi:hypothetical protein
MSLAERLDRFTALINERSEQIAAERKEMHTKVRKI